jgi:hypothetical protein
MFTLEFLAQIGVLVGTSAALYIVTQPNKNAFSADEERHNETPLRGMQRYSSYHRIRYYATSGSSKQHGNNNNTPQKQA